MPRREDDDRFEDDDRPRGSKRRDDDDDDDRPRKRSRDDDDDDFDDRPVKKSSQQGPLDGMYRDTSMVVLILFACCCNGIALILSAVAYFTAKDPTAKSNALTCMIVALVILVLGTIARIMQFVMQVGGAAGGGGF